ncbi:MAG TPA: phospho-N-acetylmuramoyl-pentapeptide-transferase [Longimicrobiaceae bacterium]|nr:phospho-N-acetylmuramoyl-pentapeptide-transferase [Longimicrobiaceae bacterium]
MLYHLLVPLSEYHIMFNLFRFQTFRAAGAVVTAFLVAFYFGPAIIRRLRMLRVGQVVRVEGPQTHLGKSGTPTMGGVLIIMATVIPTLLWSELTNPYAITVLIVLLWLGVIGFLDDYLKVVRKKTEGLKGRYKIVGQTSVGLLLGAVLVFFPFSDIPATWTQIPFFKTWHVDFWWPAYILFVTFIIVGCSNAVNLTDGLDGLAAGLSAIAATTFGVFAYIMGRIDTSDYLNLFYFPGAGELAIFCVALAGGCMGFLWFNAHPAEVFMGDTGSLAIGGVLGAVAVLVKAEFLLAIIGGVFVLEALSVMAQALYFKWTKRRTGVGRRIFRMAPLHHHFEQIGWHESKVIIRFWILGIVFALVAFATLKIR